MSRLDGNGLTEKQFLEQYDPSDYPRLSVTVDIVIFTIADVFKNNYRKLPEKEMQVLLIQRGGHPFIGQWALPGGFIRPNETVGEAANRELTEETGLQGSHLEQLYTFSKPNRDPRAWVISCSHMALVDSERLHLTTGSDAEDAQWFKVVAEQKDSVIHLSLSNGNTTLRVEWKTNSDGKEFQVISNEGLAFDHAEIIICAIQRLRSKLEYTDLAFSLMPEKFTLTQLQQVYETILGKSLYKAAFRRKIVDLVQETDLYTSDKGHRPAKLYTRKVESEGAGI